jgi:hypothetical protein
VVPEEVELTGCSVRTTQVHTVAYRMAMIEKRDRLIWAMHQEGRSQQAIGKALEAPRQTVVNVIARVTKNRNVREWAQPPEDRPALPKISWPVGTEEAEAEAADAEADAPDPGPISATDEPRYKIDTGEFLPLLDRLRPIDEGGDDMESGAVGMLDDVAADAGGEAENADALATLAMIDDIATASNR